MEPNRLDLISADSFDCPGYMTTTNEKITPIPNSQNVRAIVQSLRCGATRVLCPHATTDGTTTICRAGEDRDQRAYCPYKKGPNC